MPHPPHPAMTCAPQISSGASPSQVRVVTSSMAAPSPVLAHRTVATPARVRMQPEVVRTHGWPTMKQEQPVTRNIPAPVLRLSASFNSRQQLAAACTYGSFTPAPRVAHTVSTPKVTPQVTSQGASTVSTASTDTKPRPTSYSQPSLPVSAEGQPRSGLRQQLQTASDELRRMQMTLEEMGSQLPAAWIGACPGKVSHSRANGSKESPLSLVKHAMKQLQGSLVESLNSTERMKEIKARAASPGQRKFNASSREPSVTSLHLAGSGSRQASPVRRRPTRQASAPVRMRRPSSCSSRGGACMSSRLTGTGPSSGSRLTRSQRSDAEPRKGRLEARNLALAANLAETHSEAEASEGRSVSSDRRKRPMARVVGSRRAPLSGHVLSDARRAGTCSLPERKSLDDLEAEDSERLPKQTLAPAVLCR
ncbi:unnamed protein product [Effrenium voratum]|nr:unnamed protein product [Effrenium voratum]